jgi:hypothetical protein
MNAVDLLRLLGCQASSAEVVSALDALGTVARPSLEDEEPGARRTWIKVRRRGVELGFVDGAYLRGEPVAEGQRRGALIVDQLYLWGHGQEGIAPFAGELPHGLSFADSRDTAREKLSSLGEPHVSRPSDAFFLEDRRMVLSYRPGAQEIACLLVKLPVARWKKRYPAPRVTVERWTALFGASGDDPRFLQALYPLDVPARAKQYGGWHEVPFARDAGIELYFDEPRRFRGVRFFAERERDARGWEGPLPLGLRFADDPETLFRKLAREPAEQDEDRVSGYARWHLPEASIHVLYSTVDNTLLRVMWTVPGGA